MTAANRVLNGRDPASALFVIYQTSAASNGGLVSISEIIARAGMHTVQVITNRRSDFARQWEKRGPVEYWPMWEGGYGERSRPVARVFSRIASNVRVFLRVRRTGAVVHINDVHALWNAVFGAKLAGAKVVFNVRDTMLAGARVRKWRLCLRLCDCFLVLSREMEADWRERLSPLPLGDAAKFRHVYSIVDRSRFSPVAERDAVRGRLGLQRGRPVLLYSGRFEPKKAQLPFIREALPEIVRVRPDAVVCFVGDFSPGRDAYAASCVHAAREMGVDGHACFVGHVSSIQDWYRAADLILLASRREGLARSMIEGIASGTPVVSYAVCSAREVLEEHDVGVVVSAGDSAAFAAVTVDLLNDRDTRAEMAARGPSVAAELFDPERIAAAYGALVADLDRRHSDPGVTYQTSAETR